MGIHIHKVYTRSGDKGDTGIVGGERIAKDSLRIEAYGTVDELQAHIGALVVLLKQSEGKPDVAISTIKTLNRILNELFDLGTELATPWEDRGKWIKKPITPECIELLEKEIDGWTENVEPLKSFVLAGGGPLSVQCHIARTVCRRAERVTISFSREEKVSPEVVKYLNRLSDHLFALGRHLSHEFDEEEVLWETPLR